MLNIVSKELDKIGDICEILDKYFEYVNIQKKIAENEYDSQFEDYRDVNQEERTKHINKELTKLALHKKLQ